MCSLTDYQLLANTHRTRLEYAPMTIETAQKYLEEKYKGRQLHISSSEYGMTVCIQGTDISSFEIEKDQGVLLNQHGLTFISSWGEEYFFQYGQD